MPTDIPAAISRYESGATTPARWIEGLTPQELNSIPVPGTWSIQQLVVHVLDSDLAMTHRARRIAAEDTPLIIAYDETAFAKNLSYDKADLSLVTRLFELNRRFTAQWLRTLPADAFLRRGVHNQRGVITLAEIVDMYVNHLAHHEKFLIEKRIKLGKPL